MARPPQNHLQSGPLQSAVPDCDSQTRPAVPDSGHQMPAVHGCGTPAHELPALRGTSSLQSTTEAPRYQRQQFYSGAAITSHDSLSVATSSSQLYKDFPAESPGEPRPLPGGEEGDKHQTKWFVQQSARTLHYGMSTVQA